MGLSAITSCASDLDHETNTSDHSQFYPGPDKLLYEIFATTPGATVNGATIPAGATAYVRTRSNEVSGEFETINLPTISRTTGRSHRTSS